MRVVLYCRVSTAEQADNGVSLEAQEAKLRAFASLHDLEVAAVLVDAAESAKSLDRPALQTALTMLRRDEADALAVLKLDRLSRSVADFQTLIDSYFCERKGKELLSITDAIDTRSAGGRLVLNVLLSVAQWEREATGERTREALRHKIRNRQRVGAVRFGFDLTDDGRTLTPNPSEQSAIRLMRELRAAGRTFRAIAAELSARGIATKQGLSTWTHTAVAYIVSQDRSPA